MENFINGFSLATLIFAILFFLTYYKQILPKRKEDLEDLILILEDIDYCKERLENFIGDNYTMEYLEHKKEKNDVSDIVSD